MNVKNLCRMLNKVVPYVHHGAPFTFVFMAVTAVIYALLWFARVPANQYMIDTVLKGVHGEASLQQVIGGILLVLAVLIPGHVLNGLNAYNNMYQYFKVSGYMNYRINEQMDRMQAIDFESTEQLENMEKARKGYESAQLLVNIFHSLLFFYLPHLIFYGAYFYHINPVLIWVILLILVPQILSSFVQSQYHIDLENTLSPLRRKLEKYEECMIGKEMMKDTRSFGAFHYFQTHYKETQQTLHQKQIQVETKLAFTRLLLTMLTLAGYLGVILLLVTTMMKGAISVGTFSAAFMSLATLIGISKEMAFGTFSNLSDHFGSIQNFVSFMEKKPEPVSNESEIDYSQGIEMKNVSFQYPNTIKKALDGINLKLRAGETVAVVGENGAGKSTLAKLILGLYQPDTGTIRMADLENKKGEAYLPHQNATAVFQQFAKLAMSLKDNVRISDVSKKKSILPYLEQVSFVMNGKQFVQGEDTILAKEFGGIDLSGGQWQRLAIARGLYRRHELLVMDEPTAAIDPLEEARIFELLQTIAKDKTAVIITHRLGSVKFANRIIVLDQGKVVEEGTHEQLISQAGKYYHMYTEQAKWYERG